MIVVKRVRNRKRRRERGPAFTPPPPKKVQPLKFADDIGKFLQQATHVWFGPGDVQNAFWMAMKQRNLDSLTILWDRRNGLRMSPDLLAELPAFFNEVAKSQAVDDLAVRESIAAAIRAYFGEAGGVVLVWRIFETAIKFNLAGYEPAREGDMQWIN